MYSSFLPFPSAVLSVRFFFLMIRRPPRSTQSRSSAASDVYKRQGVGCTLSMIAIWAMSIICNLFFEIKIIMMPYIYIFCALLIIFCAPRTINIQYFSSKDIWKKKAFSLAFLTLLLVVATLSLDLRGLIVYPVFIEVLTLLPRNKINEKEKDENEKRNHYESSENINKDFA
ncbi:Accessory gene regulator protein B [Clostridium sp. C105KSO15]|nr:Accessory gene regulator protein B [Clostridium sp. C105KSO15]